MANLIKDGENPCQSKSTRVQSNDFSSSIRKESDFFILRIDYSSRLNDPFLIASVEGSAKFKSDEIS